MSLINCRTGPDLAVDEGEVAPEPSWQPRVDVQFGEGSAIQFINGESKFSPDYEIQIDYFETHVTNWDNVGAPWPQDFNSPGTELNMSNLVVSCPGVPTFDGEITVPGPVSGINIGAAMRFVIQSHTTIPPGDYSLTVSFDWTCDAVSGSFTFTIDFTKA